MAADLHFRLTQDVLAVNLSENGHPRVAQLSVGAVIALRPGRYRNLTPEMIEIESAGHTYALFACDLEERGERLLDD